MRQAVAASVAPELLASHGIDEKAADLLRAGDEDGFLARRSAALDREVLAFWMEMTEPAAPTRRPVGPLFDDEDDERD